MNANESVYIECVCHDMEHLLRITIVDWAGLGDAFIVPDESADLEICQYPKRHRFWRRIWYGLRYALGLEPPYLCVTGLNYENARYLLGIFQQYLALIDERRSKA